jgi:hypothetical protein
MTNFKKMSRSGIIKSRMTSTSVSPFQKKDQAVHFDEDRTGNDLSNAMTAGLKRSTKPTWKTRVFFFCHASMTSPSSRVAQMGFSISTHRLRKEISGNPCCRFGKAMHTQQPGQSFPSPRKPGKNIDQHLPSLFFDLRVDTALISPWSILRISADDNCRMADPTTSRHDFFLTVAILSL